MTRFSQMDLHSALEASRVRDRRLNSRDFEVTINQASSLVIFAEDASSALDEARRQFDGQIKEAHVRPLDTITEARA